MRRPESLGGGNCSMFRVCGCIDVGECPLRFAPLTTPDRVRGRLSPAEKAGEGREGAAGG